MKTILVLGADSDIAKAIINLLALQDYQFILAGRNTNSLTRTADLLRNKYAIESQVVHFDACKVNSHQRFLESIKGTFQILICAIGFLGSTSIEDANSTHVLQILDSNFRGLIPVIQSIGKTFKSQNSGKIIVISSVAGERGKGSNYLYGSAKAGLTTYLSGLRNHLYPYGVQVSTILPGYVRTKMTQGKQLPKWLTASPEQVAQSIDIHTIKGKKNVVYVISVWRFLMWIIRNIPEPIFKRLNL